MRRYANDFGGWRPLGRPSSYGADFGPRGGYDRAFRGRRQGAPWGAAPRRGYGGDFFRRRARASVQDIMTEEPNAVTGETALGDAARLMRELDVGILPVVDDLDSRRLRGVITDRDIAVRAVANGLDGGARVAECMTRDVQSCPDDADVQEVLDIMRAEQVRRVPITDRDGRLVGIVAQADLAVGYAGLDRNREIEVEEAIERISEPAQLQRQWGALRAWRG
jgi:CBS domain-containing protein